MHRKLSAYTEAGKLIDKLLGEPQTAGVIDTIDALYVYRKRLLHEAFPGGAGTRRPARQIFLRS
ncbi:MAG: hypothetical protein LBJ25_07330 [Candidatus Margulisbacteria bacterium]|jgi:hypothetical protein|nr:hypothetical protein [Candidatus Margulisiibacteriota bacterium]